MCVCYGGIIKPLSKDAFPAAVNGSQISITLGTVTNTAKARGVFLGSVSVLRTYRPVNCPKVFRSVVELVPVYVVSYMVYAALKREHYMVQQYSFPTGSTLDIAILVDLPTVVSEVRPTVVDKRRAFCAHHMDFNSGVSVIGQRFAGWFGSSGNPSKPISFEYPRRSIC